MLDLALVPPVPPAPRSKPEGEEVVLGYSHNMLLSNELNFPLNGTHCLLASRIRFDHAVGSLVVVKS